MGFWFEEYEEDPLKGLDLHTPLAKKLKRQREYILANRKTTLEERIHRRMGVYLKSDPMPDKKIVEFVSRRIPRTVTYTCHSRYFLLTRTTHGIARTERTH